MFVTPSADQGWRGSILGSADLELVVKNLMVWVAGGSGWGHGSFQPRGPGSVIPPHHMEPGVSDSPWVYSTPALTSTETEAGVSSRTPLSLV